MALLAQFLIAFGTACGRGAHYQVEARPPLPQRVLHPRRTIRQRTQGFILGHVRRALADADAPFTEHCLASGLSSGEGLIAQVRDPVGDDDTDAPADRRRLVLEQEFAQVLKVLAREGNTLSPVVRQSVGR